MSESRPQGRPRRGVAEVGREKIISRLQGVFRSGTAVDLSRKSLAELAGVTPALISYYFPKKEVLFEQISGPIICCYRAEMEEIMMGALPNNAKLRGVISLLVALYTRDGRILDMYTGVMQGIGHSDNPSRCEVFRMTQMLADFLSRWRGRPAEDDFDAAVLQGAVWGMCRFAAHVGMEKTERDHDVSMIFVRVTKLLSPGAEMLAL